jgi:hypothetical protein
MENQTNGQRAWRVNPWREAVGGISRNSVYRLMQRGELKTAKIGATRVILTPPQEFLDQHRTENL